MNSEGHPKFKRLPAGRSEIRNPLKTVPPQLDDEILTMGVRRGSGPHNRKTPRMSGPTTSSEFSDLKPGSPSSPAPPHVYSPATKAGRQIGRLGKRTAPQLVQSFPISAWLVTEP